MPIGLFSINARHTPYLSRQSYVYELRTSLTFPLAGALAEGAFTAVVATKYFEAGLLLTSVITAAPMFGNIAAVAWSEAARNRRKVPFIYWLQIGVALMIGSVALTYLMPKPIAAWVFAGQIIVARVLASGIVTLRSVIWRANYPRHIRGQIVAKISAITALVLGLTTIIGAAWLDHNPLAYVILYPVACVLGLFGAWQFSHLTVRKEGQSLRRSQAQIARAASPSTSDEADPANLEPTMGLLAFLHEARKVLREDRWFRQYQWWQFVNGASFMTMTPALLFLVSRKLTDPRKDYMLATCVLQIIPMAMLVLSTSAWAPLFDRMHITRFRVIQSWVSLSAQLLLFVGAMMGELWVIAIAQVMVGTSNAAGNLAWNLGHNDFTTPDKASTYMGVHVMLTGLRGFIAPFLGAALYAIPAIGNYVFLLAAMFCLTGSLGFRHLARQRNRLLTEAGLDPNDRTLGFVAISKSPSKTA